MNYEAFISYRRDDSEIAKRIYDTLTEQRHQVFIDVNSLLAGNFTTEIKIAIRDSELVVALLTCSSVQRMADNPKEDMVRKELETARQEARPIQFLWLMEESSTQSALYDQLAAYSEDTLLEWLARQNIMPFTDDDGDVRRICGKVLETLEAERRRKFEQIRTSTPPELHQKFPIGGRQCSYHGASRISSNGKSFPYGEGIMVDESNPSVSIIYEGNWEGDSNFSGQGTVYREQKDGSRAKLYQGHWRNLEYHDIDGRLFDEKTGNCIYQGSFLEGNRLGEESESLDGKKIYLESRLYGEEELDDGKCFKGWYHNGSPALGELQFPSGELYSGEIEKKRIQNQEGQNKIHYVPHGFGRMIYPDGRIYEGEWGDTFHSEFSWKGCGVALYPCDDMDVRVEGYFAMDNTPSDFKNVDTKVSLRLTGEQEFHPFYSSAANDVCLPGFSTKPKGSGEFFFRNGSHYQGQLKGMALYKGWLSTPVPDRREYEINRTDTSKDYFLGANDRETLELVLHCMDEMWEVFQAVAKWDSKNWKKFYYDTFLAMLHISKVTQTKVHLPEYPYGDTFARRALAMCKMPPSSLYLLGEDEDEFFSVRRWFRDCDKLDPETLEQMAEEAPSPSADSESAPLPSADSESAPSFSNFINAARIMSGDA